MQSLAGLLWPKPRIINDSEHKHSQRVTTRAGVQVKKNHTTNIAIRLLPK